MQPHVEPHILNKDAQEVAQKPDSPEQVDSGKKEPEDMEPSTGEGSLSGVANAYVDWAVEVLSLAQLEAKLVVRSAMRMLAIVCSISILLVSAWILVIASLSVWIWQAGLPLPAVLLLTACAFAVSAFVLWRWFLRTSKHLSFANTLHQLTPNNVKSERVE